MSGLKKGDKISLSISPMIQVSRYVNIRPHASVTVEVGDDPEHDMVRAGFELRRLVAAAVAMEIDAMNEWNEVIAKGDLDELKKHCVREVNRGFEGWIAGRDRIEAGSSGATHEGKGVAKKGRIEKKA